MTQRWSKTGTCENRFHVALKTYSDQIHKRVKYTMTFKPFIDSHLSPLAIKLNNHLNSQSNATIKYIIKFQQARHDIRRCLCRCANMDEVR